MKSLTKVVAHRRFTSEQSDELVHFAVTLVCELLFRIDRFIKR